MSFSDKVREEICTCITDKDKRFACLYGMILFSRTLTEKQVYFQSKSRISAETFGKLFKRVFHIELECKESHGKNGCSVYIYDIKAPEIIREIFSRYRLAENERHIDSDIISTSSLGIFTAGIFLACGSVNDPEKEYHLEFTVADEPLADELIALLGDIGVTARQAIRRGQHIVYIKGSEYIEDTLTFIGAQQCTLDMINVKIYKDIRNKANRITNCDSANIDKTVNASLRQIEDISLIAETQGLDSLPDELLEIAQLRLENSVMSLRDIGESLSEPISRSGVNHRFQRIARIADEIRKERDKN
ncbi:MAG: DNA-binding protein WhiA [Ruminococcus flavefaciens]|nr:DNA-binding protein WhiA [Ruminococcus flavefaciens]MCM1231642.1 DNA-binding protein WhiA [Ruminococcus flavefaciens]